VGYVLFALLLLAAESRAISAAPSMPAPPSGNSWWDYQIIMWQAHTPEQNAALKQLGITGGKVIASRIDLPASSDPSVLAQLIGNQAPALIASRMRWYVDNIATDFYSPYHMQGAKAAFRAVRALYDQNPNDPAVFMRHPGLSDKDWLERIHTRLINQVQAYRNYRPLFYNLGDEPGIAELSTAWDFDISDSSLQGMRDWLRERYGSLVALNAQWGTDFADWNAVVPQTTDQAMRRTDGNFSSWADFKDWMNVAFARAIRMGTDAVHSADPDALAAITGTQTPGWGGYDYTLLANAVDVIEPYDIGGNVDIVHALNPGLAIVTTSFRDGPAEAHRVWRELLHGNRGLILWAPRDHDFVRDDGTPSARGREAAPYFGEIRAGLGALMINSRPAPAEVAVLYSPASMRTQWMLDWQPKGDAWAKNGMNSGHAETGADIAGKLIVHLGLQHQIVSAAMLAQGVLQQDRWRALILPDAIALSPQEAAEIRRFVERGGTVIADREPGLYDEHSRRLDKPLLADIFKAPPAAGLSFPFGKGKAAYMVPQTGYDDPAAGSDARSLRDLRQLLIGAKVQWPFTLADSAGRPVDDVETHVFQNGKSTIIALQRDLPAPGAPDTARSARIVTLSLPHSSFVYDVRTKQALGNTDRLSLALDAYEPTILAIANAPLPLPSVTAAQRVRRGETTELHIGFDAPPDGAMHVVHLDAVPPSGRIVAEDSENLLIPDGAASKPLRLPASAETGSWKIRVTDVLSGQMATATLQVTAN